MNITTQFLDSSESFLSNYSFQDNIPDVLLEGFWVKFHGNLFPLFRLLTRK